MEVRLFGVARDICSNYFAIGDSLFTDLSKAFTQSEFTKLLIDPYCLVLVLRTLTRTSINHSDLS
ncbi:hypothetical protein VCHA49P379_140106 [Vibrio chagasii]|nr:hypothetical protein VCHA37P191_130038 [Vibrio chagasii]CAH6979941.1 hypothetical protein VCHA49P379_140106 [Vibrio chagasii]CAH7466825.1 hypothetical protein VCHA53O464_60107 [Vibrio chagasii]